MITHGTPPVADGGWSEFIKDFGIGFSWPNANGERTPVLRPCCAEWLVRIGKPLISLVPSRNVLQHENGVQNEAVTARNPLFSMSSAGALGEIRTPDPRNRNPMLYPAELRAPGWPDYQTWPARASSARQKQGCRRRSWPI